MNRRPRPVGVILSAIVLGLGAFLLLAMALMTLLGALLSAHAPANPAGTQAPAGAVAAIGTAMAFFYVVLAAWAITTLVGLVRLRPWARISTMILGGGIAIIGLFTTFLCLAMPTLMASMPMPPNANANPQAMRAIFFSMAFVSLFVAGIGVWWLVYFALRNTRAAFNPAVPPPYFDLNSTNAPSPISTDFLQHGQQATYVAPQTPTNRRPVSITILAVIFFLSGTMMIPTLFLSQPLLFFSFSIHGKIAVVVKLLFALWAVATGIGLLKLQKPAWHLAISYCGFCILNTVAILLPGGIQRMQGYMHDLMAANPMTPAMAPAFDPFSGPFFRLLVIPGFLFGFAIIAFAIVLLWRARWAFGLASRSDQAAA